MFWEVVALITIVIILTLLLYLYIRQRILRETCNVPVRGFIKSIREHESPSMNDADLVHGDIAYVVTIGYQYNGQDYEYTHYAMRREFGELKIGTPINIRIDQNNPNKVYCSERLESELNVF